MKPYHTSGEYECRDLLTYHQMILFVEKIFSVHDDKLHRVKHLAKKIRDGIERLDPFIEQATQIVCPQCKAVCCISKHGYYKDEDLIYLFALGLRPPDMIFGKDDADPCQFLIKTGCSMARWQRPSGCNWYFCDSLLDYMEPQPAYQDFDEILRDVAELWIEMIEEFKRYLPNGSPGQAGG